MEMLMKEYKDLVNHVLNNGETKEDRTKTGTVSIFGPQIQFDLRKGFPLLTTKEMKFKSIVRELLWLIKGSTNVKDLHPCKIWDNWADENGELGPIYGAQWRRWQTYESTQSTCKGQLVSKLGSYHKSEIDQLEMVIQDIKTDPNSRRLIVSAWNVADIYKMALPPCHCFFQFNVVNGFLDLKLYQRSADLAIGVPFNIASYALLLMMVAQECNLIPRYFIHSFGDLHIYINHIKGLREQITREPYSLPKVSISDKSIFDITINDIKLEKYGFHQSIKFEIAV